MGKINAQDVIGVAPGVGLIKSSPKAGRVVGVLGTSDLYTVPPGKVAFVSTWFRNNPTGGAITTGIDIISGANSMRVNTSSASLGAGGVGGVSVSGTCALMTAGEILRVTDSAAGMIHYYSVMEAPADLNSFLKLVRSFAMSTVAEKIYEAPAGKIGVPTTQPVGGGVSVFFFNNSGTGAKICTLYLVPPGQAVAAQYSLGVAAPADNGNAASLFSLPWIPPGFSLWVTSSSNDAGVKCRALISEYDA